MFFDDNMGEGSDAQVPATDMPAHDMPADENAAVEDTSGENHEVEAPADHDQAAM